MYKILGYTEYGKFLPAINRAKISCETSKQNTLDHFAEVSDMVKIGSGAERKINDYNLFRATQAEAKLKRENIQGEKNANEAHFEVGKTVRGTIEELGGTMPEDLPVADGIGKAKMRVKKLENGGADVLK